MDSLDKDCPTVKSAVNPYTFVFADDRWHFIVDRRARLCQTESVTTAIEIRAEARRQLRDAFLDAAQEITVSEGWHRLRMGTVAARLGVSRQTLHAEFGTREALGQALIMRETEQFLRGVSECLDRHPGKLAAAVSEAVQYTLDRAAEDPLLRTVLTSARGGDDSLLPLLTTRSEPILHAASAALRGYADEHFPYLDPERVAAVVDNVVRLTVSHIVLPAAPADVIARRLGQLVLDGLHLPDERLEAQEGDRVRRKPRN